ncbi:MAG: hypothetical protein ABIS18_11475 [Actinomycetota bacterium]
MSIEPALRFFDFGHPSFVRLVEDFRRGIVEEVAKSDLPGLVFTYAWAFNLPQEAETVKGYAAPFVARGSRILYLELECSLKERLRRNETAFRLAEKPSKRDIVRSRERLLEHEERYQFNSSDEYRSRGDWLRVDITGMEAEEAAEHAIRHFQFPRLGVKRERSENA